MLESAKALDIKVVEGCSIEKRVMIAFGHSPSSHNCVFAHQIQFRGNPERRRFYR
jgi:hypothetical protein